ncbi:hypothetical protein NQZ68_001427 [Dissostichus eleginoides]|nr:hypothetical protein NQZ68_001427 [Dissostichus eleginoides]
MLLNQGEDGEVVTAARIKVVIKEVEKIQRGRGLNCVNTSAWERRKQRGVKQREGEEERKNYDLKGGRFPTPSMVKAVNFVSRATISSRELSLCSSGDLLHDPHLSALAFLCHTTSLTHLVSLSPVTPAIRPSPRVLLSVPAARAAGCHYPGYCLLSGGEHLLQPAIGLDDKDGTEWGFKQQSSQQTLQSSSSQSVKRGGQGPSPGPERGGGGGDSSVSSTLPVSRRAGGQVSLQASLQAGTMMDEQPGPDIHEWFL